MKTHLKRIIAGIAGLIAAVSLAYGLTNPPTFAPRQFPSQQTHYLRFSFNFNSCVLASGYCSVKVGAVPYNSWIERAGQQIITNFNSGSTDTVGIGTSSAQAGNGSSNLVALQSVHSGAGGATALTIIAANRGTVNTGDLTASTGSEGGFDIWVGYVQTGAVPTAGAANYFIEYIAPNDGTCTTVAIGSTAAAC